MLRAGLGSRFGRVVGVVSAAVAVAAISAPGAAAKSSLKAEIIRSKGGIPTIRADDYKSLGFGYAYAFAEDNLCTIAEAYVTANGERSRYFGPDADSPDGYTNLQSDLFYQRIKDRGIIDELISQPPPIGPKPQIKQLVAGYVAGYNRYLQRTGVANLPDPTCAGAPWVRKITTADVYQRFYQLTQLATGQIAEDGIVEAQPPGPAARPAAGAAEVTPGEVAKLGAALEQQRGGIGSNGWGLGSEATANGSGMVLGNPHFPWQGSERFYQSHLVIPGELNVSGASLFGTPVVLIGHTDNLAWTHTVSTAFRFTPMELHLVPGDPTSYLVDGQPVQMERNDVTVQVQQPDGSLAPVTRTLYTTKYGPVINSLQGQPLFAWTNTTAYAMYDANADNLRLLNHYFDTDHAQSTTELLRILKKYEGIPWVNTMASDSRGKALYADIGAIPNVPDAKATGDCAASIGALTFGALGLPSLDGSRSECAPGTDSDSVVPGIFGPSNEPSMFRRDYVANSNDSQWLTNPEQPLEGYATIIGDQRTPRSLRTRLGLKMIEQRLAGTDGYAGDKFTVNRLRRIEFNDRLYGAELLRGAIAAFCHANPTLTGAAGTVDVSEACPVLDGFDEKQNLDSNGAILFRRFMSQLGSVPYTTPFDVADPVNTPFGLDTADPAVGAALADAVTDLRGAGIALDAPLGQYQYEPRGTENIPIHGGPDGQGAFNVITDPWEPPAGYPDVTDGSSFIMVAGFNEGGEGCVRDRTILTYSESANPSSKHFADQTKLYSQKRWIDPPFCPGQVERAARSTTVIRGG